MSRRIFSCITELIHMLVVFTFTIHLFGVPGIVSAQLPVAPSDIDRINRGQDYRDPEDIVFETSTCGPSASVGDAYIIGDSITVGAKGQIQTEFESIGASTTINAVVSRSLTTGNLPVNGLSVLDNDRGSFTNSDAVIIALGTNGGISVSNIAETIELVKSVNIKATIYWVNIGVNNDVRDGSAIPYESINQIIESESNNGENYRVIDWAKVVEAKPEIIAEDGLGVHIKTESNSEFSSEIIKSVAGSSTGCSTNLTGADNAEKVWNYMISQGLQPFQVAGFMGNMQAESGFEPRRTEYAYSEKPNLSDTVPLPPNCANSESNSDPTNLGLNCFPGYGLVQWTTTGRKQGLRDIGATTGRSEGDLGLQLDYVWQEINQRTLNKSDMVALYGRISTLEALLQTTSVEAATFLIAREYEIPGDFAGTLPVRTGFARTWLQKFGSGGSS
jgi:hypothetical protein